MREYKPLNNYVLVEQDAAEEKTEGGLFLPQRWFYNDYHGRTLFEKKIDRPLLGTVHAVGPGAAVSASMREPMPLEPGDRVAFRNLRGAGFVDKDDRRDLLLVLVDDIVARLTHSDGGDLHVQALFDNVLIDVDPPKEATEGGIILTENAQAGRFDGRETCWTGTVIAAGAGKPIYRKRDRMFVYNDWSGLVDKNVRWPEGGGYWMTIGSQTCVLVSAHDLLAEAA